MNPDRVSSAQTRAVVLVVACFLLGIGVGAFWFYRDTQRETIIEKSVTGLSEGTRLVLKNLSAPVEIRFYSLLDPATTSPALRDFAGRVDQLLSNYEQEAAGKIKVVRHITPSGSADQAAADGIKVFNLDKGEACYLGLALTSRDQKETLPHLSPEWETALEPDLSRAVARVGTPKPVARSHTAGSIPAPIDANTVAAVKRTIPNLDQVSLADAKQSLRAATLKEFTEATEVMQRALTEAEEQVAKAKSGNEAEQQAAVKNLQKVQAEHNEKLKQITARLQEQIEALEQIKQK